MGYDSAGSNMNGGVVAGTGSSNCGLNTWYYSHYAMTWKPNQGGGIDLGWESSQPSGSSVAAHGISYDDEGDQWASGGWVYGAGTKTQTIQRVPGNVTIEFAWKTNNASALPTLHYLFHNLH